MITFKQRQYRCSMLKFAKNVAHKAIFRQLSLLRWWMVNLSAPLILQNVRPLLLKMFTENQIRIRLQAANNGDKSFEWIFVFKRRTRKREICYNALSPQAQATLLWCNHNYFGILRSVSCDVNNKRNKAWGLLVNLIYTWYKLIIEDANTIFSILLSSFESLGSHLSNIC